MTERRLVVLFPGFEPMPPAAHLARFRREAARTAGTIGMRLAFNPVADDVLDVEAAGEGWRRETRIVLCGWDDLIAAYRDASPARRTWRGLVALVDVAATGTAFRYFTANWRYGLFYLYPLVQVAAALGAGALVAAWLPAASGIGRWAGVAAGLVLTAALFWLAVRRLHLLLLFDDWSLALDLARGGEATEARVRDFARRIGAHAGADPPGEIVLAAHSLGASFAVPALRIALDAGLAGPRPMLLTVGSSLLKTALHPAARPLREAVAALVRDWRIAWLDVQAVADPMNFYGVNPAASLKISGGRQPVVRRVSFRRLISPEHYRRVRLDLFRTHRQFVYGIERGRQYAFHEILLGPRPFESHLEPRP